MLTQIVGYPGAGLPGLPEAERQMEAMDNIWYAFVGAVVCAAVIFAVALIRANVRYNKRLGRWRRGDYTDHEREVLGRSTPITRVGMPGPSRDTEARYLNWPRS